MTALTLLSLGLALGAAALAGVLAMAEEAPPVARTAGEEALRRPGALPLQRAFHVARLALLVLAGVAAALAIGWWYRPRMQGWLVAVVAAAFLFVIGDGLPRMIGGLAPELSTIVARGVRRMLVAFRPLIGLVASVERLTRRIPPLAPRSSEPLGTAQRDILLGVFSLGDTTVAEIMTPRLDIVALETDTDWREVVDVLRRGEHARVPVYSDTLDNVSAVLHAKDLVPAIAGLTPPPERWQDLARPVQFVPESKTLASQLRDFQRGPGHIAIVVDEFGGTSGLVTLEDVLEEVVGEIHDEYDVDEEPAVEREGEDRFWVDGRVTLDELSALLGVALERDDVSTVGGLIYSELGRVPGPGEELVVAGFRVVVEQVARRRIRRVYFERLPGRPVAADAEEARE